MPRVITYPDIDYDVDRPKVLVRNANWDDAMCQRVVDELSDKEYDIYPYHTDINDFQWEEGIRAKARVTLDAEGKDTIEWLKEFDAGFNV